jgi:hypothetical protein
LYLGPPGVTEKNNLNLERDRRREGGDLPQMRYGEYFTTDKKCNRIYNGWNMARD